MRKEKHFDCNCQKEIRVECFFSSLFHFIIGGIFFSFFNLATRPA